VDTSDDTITIKRHEWEAVLDRLAALEGAEASERPVPDTSGAEAPHARTGVSESAGNGGVTRRRALGLAGATAVGVVAATTWAQPAAAADADPLIIGSTTNSGTKATKLDVTPTNTVPKVMPDYGLGVTDNGLAALPPSYKPTVLGHAKGTSFNTAALLLGEGNAYALVAHSERGAIGAFSDTATPLFAEAQGTDVPALEVHDNGGPGAVTVYANQNHFALRNGPNAAPTTRATFQVVGTVVAQPDGTLWYCTATGTPGAWRQLTANSAAGSLHVLPAPVRVYDSRLGTSPSVPPKTPLAANTERTLDLTVNGSTVPKGATAALVTCLLVNAATGNGNFTIWSNAAPRPQSNTLVWGGNTGRFTATAVTALDNDAKVKVQASMQTDLVLDVVGYYR
jgi:hypothetical protein